MRPPSNRVDIFFYGLFMDVDLLRSKGLRPERPRIGWVDDTRLVIGARAALVTEPGARAYGVVLSLPAEDVQALYADDSLRAYTAGRIHVRLEHDGSQAAVCYNAPVEEAGEPDARYASRLRDVARHAGLPDEYVSSI